MMFQREGPQGSFLRKGGEFCGFIPQTKERGRSRMLRGGGGRGGVHPDGV